MVPISEEWFYSEDEKRVSGHNILLLVPSLFGERGLFSLVYTNIYRENKLKGGI
jgi:hypothetical protein